MQLHQITTAEDLDSALHSGTSVLFKHSILCPVSAKALREAMHFLKGFEGATPAEFGWVSVTENRELSNVIAERTGSKHESPQAFVLVEGVVQWEATHGAITREALSDAWNAALA